MTRRKFPLVDPALTERYNEAVEEANFIAMIREISEKKNRTNGERYLLKTHGALLQDHGDNDENSQATRVDGEVLPVDDKDKVSESANVDAGKL